LRAKRTIKKKEKTNIVEKKIFIFTEQTTEKNKNELRRKRKLKIFF